MGLRSLGLGVYGFSLSEFRFRVWGFRMDVVWGV